MVDTDCVVVGGGPGGMVLAHLLARGGIRVTLLEGHADFDRDFRGDSLHTYTLELLEQLGLAGSLLELPHFKATRFRAHTPVGVITLADYGQLTSKFPYLVLMPQARFLDFLARKSSELPTFALRTGARVRELIMDDDRTVGVRWRGPDGPAELTARVVVAADGRFSRLRTMAGGPVIDLGASSDLLWFRLPRREGDPPEADVDLYFGRRNYVALLGGVSDWQIGYTLPKGGFAAAREAGVEPIRAFLRQHVGWLGDRIELLTGFEQTTLLSVELKRLATWHRPGLLFIGDAAHVISPVGGNGILMAIQDAVTAADHLIPALRRPGPVPVETLAAIQAEREDAITRVQADQAKVERQALRAREAGRALIPGRLLKIVTALPGVRARGARSNAYGPSPPRLDPTLFAPETAHDGHRVTG
jgi:2-polyprenyl-6-methoxyphenol hydroxylase-like FAD-dependent oxidoreductase